MVARRSIGTLRSRMRSRSVVASSRIGTLRSRRRSRTVATIILWHLVY